MNPSRFYSKIVKTRICNLYFSSEFKILYFFYMNKMNTECTVSFSILQMTYSEYEEHSTHSPKGAVQVEFQEALNWKLQYKRDMHLNSGPLIHLSFCTCFTFDCIVSMPCYVDFINWNKHWILDSNSVLCVFTSEILSPVPVSG